MIRIFDTITLGCSFQLLKNSASVADERQSRVLVGVELGDVDVDKSHIRILKRSLGGGCEIAVSSANADDEIGFARDNIGPRSSSHANRAQILRVVEAQRTLCRPEFRQPECEFVRQSAPVAPLPPNR